MFIQFNKNGAEAAKEDSDDESESEDDAGNAKGGKRTRQKESKRKKEEEAIRNREVNLAASSPESVFFFWLFVTCYFQTALLDGSLLPDSPKDFERLLLAEPNSSYLWIQYMAYHLKSADVESARGVAERALKSISFREEEVSQFICYNHARHNYLRSISGKIQYLESLVER